MAAARARKTDTLVDAVDRSLKVNTVLDQDVDAGVVVLMRTLAKYLDEGVALHAAGDLGRAGLQKACTSGRT